MKIILSVLFACAVLVSTAGNTEKDKNETKTAESSSVLVFSGKIVDSGSQENLVGVKVSIANTNIVAFTDFEGKFSFEMPSNLHESEIKVSYISYEETTVKLNGKDDTLIELNQIH